MWVGEEISWLLAARPESGRNQIPAFASSSLIDDDYDNGDDNADDFIQVQHYIFVVQAQDTGRPSLSSTVTVYFNVLDLNDNAPLFDPMSYSDELYENITIGSSVITVSATDQDSGEEPDHSVSSLSVTGSLTVVLVDRCRRQWPLDLRHKRGQR